MKAGPGGWWPGLIAIAVTTAYVIALLAAERQNVIIALLAAGIVAVIVAARLRLFEPVTRSFIANENGMGLAALAAALVIAGYFHEEHFVLLLVITVILTTVATLGLNVQFGYAGVLNFAGASF